MRRERILITVKTYPTLSKKYGETVCTAGVREDGTWVRLYPVPFRRLEESEQYRKFDWVECRIARNTSDPRPESFRPADHAELQATAHMGTGEQWRDRRKLLLNTARVYDRLGDLIAGAKANELSLAVFKPTRILDFVWEADDPEWDPKKLEAMRAHQSQMGLFDADAWDLTFKVIPKLPYKFSYRFEDAAGRKSELQVLDWEVGALYWNCLRSASGDQAVATAKVRQKYIDEFTTNDLHFFLGTIQLYHLRAPNPWVIIGVFPIPHKTQETLL